MLDIVYLLFAFFTVIATLTALVRGRALGWLVPLWFLTSLVATELALPLLLLELLVLLTAVAFLGSDTLVSLSHFLLMLSILGNVFVLRRHIDSGSTFERALRTGLGVDFESGIPLSRRMPLSHQINSNAWFHPTRFQRPGVRVERDIAYGPAGKRNLLDIYLPARDGQHRPVLLHVHGGAWVMGHKAEQAQPLLHHMAALGWVCVSINYRLSPRATFPDHIVDVKRAIAWTRQHISGYGGDPRFIAITGGSAGGHLASLAALSAGANDWQPGFEAADTSIQAAMPLYGCYDLCDRHEIRYRNRIDGPVGRALMKVSKEASPQLWDRASPISWVSEEAPPFFVIQGSHDTLIWVEEARRFVAELSSAGSPSVVYAELEGAQHAFDLVHSPRTSHFLNAAALWLEWAHADWCAKAAE